MNPIALLAFQAHARAEFPRECCGVIAVIGGRERYMRCRNIAESVSHFIIHPEDYATAEDAGEIVAICHSHPNMPPLPSEADRAGCESSGLTWHILNVHRDGVGPLHSFDPSGYEAPLLGVPFAHGVHDCYTLIQRYYRHTLDIALPDFAHEEKWWEKGQNLYMENFGKAGFVLAEDPLREHDVILMKLASPVPNHAAVYLGNNQVMQHIMNRLSSRDIYGGWFQKITVTHVRHRSLL